MAKETERKISKLGCCPELVEKPLCDVLNFRYSLPFRPNLDNRTNVRVDVILHFQLMRCSGPLVIGDPIYSTTLLPGEEVRLFTSDRHSEWSYDSESELSYRQQTTSEESFYTASMAKSMSDLTISESGKSSSSYEESHAEGGGGASFSFLGIIEIGGGGGGGSYDAHSAKSFSHSLSKHAESTSMYAAAGVRSKSATSIGEVQSRTHKEGESESQYESASRKFKNYNKCHAVTYLFRKINKIQKISFKLVAIERRVYDPAALTGVTQRIKPDLSGQIKVKPEVISAAGKNRLELERNAKISDAESRQNVFTNLRTSYATVSPETFSAASNVSSNTNSINENVKEAALNAVDKDLVKAGFLDARTRKVSQKLIAEVSWTREEILPTPGIIVKGCLDECDTCSDELQEEVALELERKRLENQLLQKQIDLLEKSQEYRCCPENQSEDEADDGD